MAAAVDRDELAEAEDLALAIVATQPTTGDRLTDELIVGLSALPRWKSDPSIWVAAMTFLDPHRGN